MKYEEEILKHLTVDQIALFRDTKFQDALRHIEQVAPLYGGNPILQALHILLDEATPVNYFNVIKEGGKKVWEIVAIIAQIYHRKEMPQKRVEVTAQDALTNAWLGSQAFYAFIGALQRVQEPISKSQLQELLETEPKNPAKFYARIPEINKKLKIQLPSNY
jgi:hypothetical protein